MPLLDHFHPPLHPFFAWESFHGSWCNSIMRSLNQRLRPRFVAAFQIYLGSRIEADVAEFDRDPEGVTVQGNGEGSSAVATYAPPQVTCAIDAVFPDDIEVQVLDTRDGAKLVAVVELVSPGNKDRPEAREAFTAKCAAYLQRGLGVIVVDVVTTRHANLHNELMERLHQRETTKMPAEAVLYVAAYRPVHRDVGNKIDVWLARLELGQELPTMPLALRGFGCVPVDLDASYARAREDSGI